MKLVNKWRAANQYMIYTKETWLDQHCMDQSEKILKSHGGTRHCMKTQWQHSNVVCLGMCMLCLARLLIHKLQYVTWFCYLVNFETFYTQDMILVLISFFYMQLIISENVFKLLLQWFERAIVILFFSQQVALVFWIPHYNQELQIHKSFFFVFSYEQFKWRKSGSYK